jgi:hypothetical protein
MLQKIEKAAGNLGFFQGKMQIGDKQNIAFHGWVGSGLKGYKPKDSAA